MAARQRRGDRLFERHHGDAGQRQLWLGIGRFHEVLTGLFPVIIIPILLPAVKTHGFDAEVKTR
jgi:hypothetical protein